MDEDDWCNECNMHVYDCVCEYEDEMTRRAKLENEEREADRLRALQDD